MQNIEHSQDIFMICKKSASKKLNIIFPFMLIVIMFSVFSITKKLYAINSNSIAQNFNLKVLNHNFLDYKNVNLILYKIYQLLILFFIHFKVSSTKAEVAGERSANGIIDASPISRFNAGSSGKIRTFGKSCGNANFGIIAIPSPSLIIANNVPILLTLYFHGGSFPVNDLNAFFTNNWQLLFHVIIIGYLANSSMLIEVLTAKGWVSGKTTTISSEII